MMSDNETAAGNGWLYSVTVWTTVFIAGLGFIFSYITLTQVAAAFQMHMIQVIIFPLLLDLFMVVAHSAYFYLSRLDADRRLVTVIMYLTVALSVIFNLDHVWPTENYLMLIAWGLPPVILLLSVKTITAMVKTHQQPISNLSATYQETTKPIIEDEQGEQELTAVEQAVLAIEQNPGLTVREYAQLSGTSNGTVNKAKKLLTNGHQS